MTNETFGAEYLETIEAPKFGGSLRTAAQCPINWTMAECYAWVHGGRFDALVFENVVTVNTVV